MSLLFYLGLGAEGSCAGSKMGFRLGLLHLGAEGRVDVLWMVLLNAMLVSWMVWRPC